MDKKPEPITHEQLMRLHGQARSPGTLGIATSAVFEDYLNRELTRPIEPIYLFQVETGGKKLPQIKEELSVNGMEIHDIAESCIRGSDFPFGESERAILVVGSLRSLFGVTYSVEGISQEWIDEAGLEPCKVWDAFALRLAFKNQRYDFEEHENEVTLYCNEYTRLLDHRKLVVSHNQGTSGKWKTIGLWHQHGLLSSWRFFAFRLKKDAGQMVISGRHMRVGNKFTPSTLPSGV